MNKRAALHTLGCRLNQSETALIEAQLRASGYTIVPFDSEADLGIVNTCTVTNEADAKSRKAVRGFIRRNPEAFVAVIGCYAQMGADILRRLEGVDLIVGNQEKLNVLEYAGQGKNDTPLVVRDSMARKEFTIEPVAAPETGRRANVKVQDGCDFMCSFCIIPFARGRARSRDFENLVDEARSLIERGAKEIVLTGVNIGTYGHGGHDIVAIVDALDALGAPRVRISSIEPTTIPGELLDRMAGTDHALVPHLHVPLQSGSDRVLALMRRKYACAEFVEFIEEAARRVPELCIGTDIMVGAPGETETDFELTCEVLRDAPIAYAHVFKYSERDGTAAVRIPGKVDGNTKNRRSTVIRCISAQKLRNFQEKFLGTDQEVLFECGKKGVWNGYTPNYVRVETHSDAILDNRLARVRLREICGDLVAGEVILVHEDAYA